MKNPTRTGAPWPWIITVAGLLALGGVVVAKPFGRNVGPRSGHAPVVVPTGRSDASLVLDPAGFADAQQRDAYTAAREIPAVLNQLYCWCHCKENPQTHHRSLLECFESQHGSRCDICMGSAMIARMMVKQGVTDVRTIQDQIDARFGGPPAGS